MKDILNPINLALALIAFAAIGWAFRTVSASDLVPRQFGNPGSNRVIAVNIAEGTHDDTIQLASDEAVATRHLLMTCTSASDTDHFAICAAAEEPIGVCPDEVASDEVGESRAIHLLGRGPTRRMVASEAITKGEWVYTAAAGKVQDEPAVAGTYYRVGRALSAAGADGDLIEVETEHPVKLVVIAALGNANGAIAALTSSATTTQAEFNALRDACETLADDVRAIGTALAAPALVKVLAA